MSSEKWIVLVYTRDLSYITSCRPTSSEGNSGTCVALSGNLKAWQNTNRIETNNALTIFSKLRSTIVYAKQITRPYFIGLTSEMLRTLSNQLNIKSMNFLKKNRFVRTNLRQNKFLYRG